MADPTPVPLKAGILAYYDTTFNGLIPCKVLDLRQGDYGRWKAQIQLTTTHKAYKRGEVLWVPASDVPPRDKRCVYRRDHHIRVRCAWHVEFDGRRYQVFAPANA